MLILCAMLCGFTLDLALGDPDWMPHPVVYMGKCIFRLETFLRRVFPKTEEGELRGGAVLAAVLPLGTLAFTKAVCTLAAWISPLLLFLVETVWCWQALSARGLAEVADVPGPARGQNRRGPYRRQGHGVPGPGGDCSRGGGEHRGEFF